ncbi:hypothetical protein [Cetobacterium sp.]|uniref:hypothetical protein n=1 Tax=Cetobacterium sp. TaxID=2071632 RepID=UPI003EE79B81
MIKLLEETDLAYGYYVEKIKTKIISFNFENENEINIILEYFNIIKYYENIKVKEWLDLESDLKSIKVIEYMKNKVIEFIRNENKKIFLYYDQVDIEYLKDFWEIIETNGLYKQISEKEFEEFLKTRKFLFYIFKFERIVKKFSDILKKYLLEKNESAEFLITKYFEDIKETYIPNSLTDNEKNEILKKYIKSDKVNMNYLRNILDMPNKQLKITDKVRLLAKKKLQEETAKFFGNTEKNGMEIRVVWGEKQNYSECNGIFEYSYDLNWIKENLDYNTLLNNFIYLFEYVDLEMRLNLTSKKAEIGTYERVFFNNGPSQYRWSFVFEHKDLKSRLEMISYSKVLIDFGIRLENIIEWFFKEYLVKEFGIRNFITKMPGEKLSYFEKCKVIIPEIDRILKQYNYYLDDGEISQELLQISSTHLLFNNCESINIKKYIYIKSQKLKNIAHLFYSNQSELAFVKGIECKEMTFINLLLEKKLKFEMFESFQIEYLKWLVNEKIIHEDEDKILRLTDINLIYIVKEFYMKEVINYWRCHSSVRKKLDELLANNEVIFENKLFTRGEIDYLNYHLNKSSFGNSLDLRNRYAHGTHSNDDLEHKNNYYIFLKLIVIIIIKINDDLCLDEISKESNNKI